MFVRVFAAVVVVGIVAGCGPEPAPVIARETFVEVMADLRLASMETDSAAFEARKLEILASAGVTDSMLLAFARAHGADVEFMVAVWDSIDAVVNPNEDVDLMGADTVHVP